MKKLIDIERDVWELMDPEGKGKSPWK